MPKRLNLRVISETTPALSICLLNMQKYVFVNHLIHIPFHSNHLVNDNAYHKHNYFLKIQKFTPSRLKLISIFRLTDFFVTLPETFSWHYRNSIPQFINIHMAFRPSEELCNHALLAIMRASQGKRGSCYSKPQLSSVQLVKARPITRFFIQRAKLRAVPQNVSIL